MLCKQNCLLQEVEKMHTSEQQMEDAGLSLPEELLSCAIRRGNEYAWRKKDLLRVVAAAEEAGIAANGWQVQFRSPDGAFELCWNSFGPAAARENESWNEHVSRSWDETRQTWQKLFDNKEFIEEGRKIFRIIQETEDEGLQPRDLLWFVLYFRSSNQKKPGHSHPSPPATCE